MRLTENVTCGPDNNDHLLFKGIPVGYVVNLDCSYSMSEWRRSISFRLEHDFEHFAYHILQEFKHEKVYATYRTELDLDPQVLCKGGKWVIEMRPN
jgi:heat shock protein HspQ